MTSRLYLYVVVVLLGMSPMANATPVLMPFDLAVNTSKPISPLLFDVVNPYSAPPVLAENIEILPLGLGPAPNVFSGPIHATLSTRIDVSGHSVGLIDFYYDGTPASFPSNAYLSFYFFMTSPPANGQVSEIALTTNTPSEQAGFITTNYLSPVNSSLRHNISAKLPAESSLLFGQTFAYEPSFNKVNIFYVLQKPSPDTVIDTSQSLFRVEVAVLGVPEPSTISLAAIGLIAFAGLARRRRWR